MDAKIGKLSDITMELHDKRVVGIKPGQGDFRALIVDDRETNRDLLVQMMSMVGFEVREAVNGLEAIDIHEDWQPQLILMDLVMPEMGGREASNIIREKNTSGGDTTIIAVTASVLADERDDVLAQGVDDFIRKPFREADLFTRISKHMKIEFIYEGVEPEREAASVEDHDHTLVIAALKTMPVSIMGKFRTATEAVDTEQLHELINQAGELDNQVANTLRDLVDNFDFDALEEIFHA